jgi:predicted metalloprotease with PDZ domain
VDSTRYPWRILALAAISLIGNVFLSYYLLFGLAADGIGLEEQSGRVVVTDVDEHTAGASAGLQPGDQILNVNGQQIIRVVDWFAQRMNFQADQQTAIRVQRGAKTLDLALVVHGSIWNQRNSTQRASTIIFLAYNLITLLI